MEKLFYDKLELIANAITRKKYDRFKKILSKHSMDKEDFSQQMILELLRYKDSLIQAAEDEAHLEKLMLQKCNFVFKDILRSCGTIQKTTTERNVSIEQLQENEKIELFLKNYRIPAPDAKFIVMDELIEMSNEALDNMPKSKAEKYMKPKIRKFNKVFNEQLCFSDLVSLT